MGFACESVRPSGACVGVPLIIYTCQNSEEKKNNKKKKTTKKQQQKNIKSGFETVLLNLQINAKHLVCWVKISADNILKYFLYFPQKIGFDISCKLSPNLHEKSVPIFWEQEKYQFVVCWIFQESGYGKRYNSIVRASEFVHSGEQIVACDPLVVFIYNVCNDDLNAVSSQPTGKIGKLSLICWFKFSRLKIKTYFVVVQHIWLNVDFKSLSFRPHQVK